MPQTITIDFGGFLPPGVTLVGTPQVSLGLHWGDDADPQSRITGGPSVGTASQSPGTGVTDAAVLVQVTGVGGNDYLAWAKCDRSDGSDQASGWLYVNCVTPS